MLPIKRGGFTLIEVLAAISILGLVGLISSSFFLTILSSSSKAEVAKEVRQNGDYVLSVMQGLILSASSASCSDDHKSIAIKDTNGSPTTFSCNETTTYKISSNSADLTGSNVLVSGCSFICEQVAGAPTKVSVEFTVSQKGSGTLRPSEKSSQIFKSEIIMRNL